MMSAQIVKPQIIPAVSESRTTTHLPAALSLIAGMVDVTSWLTLGGLFAAHITGNLVIIAANSFNGKSPHLVQILAVPVFIAAVAIADQACRVFRGEQTATVNALLFLQAVLLVGVTWISLTRHTSDHPLGLSAEIAGMLAVSSMAVQNTLVHLVKKYAATTGVMTGNLVVCALSLLEIVSGDVDRDEALLRWRATWPLFAGFLAGCLIGSLAVSRIGAWAWIYPTGSSLLLFMLRWRKTKTHLLAARFQSIPRAREGAHL
jgi:uncharacterized membrane protein YoaK (UPF0700 family)